MERTPWAATAGGLLVVALSAGCASGLAFSGKSEAPAAAIRAAEEVGAVKIPLAALHLQLAKEELERARGEAGKGEEDQAISLLMRVEADAELAITLAREHQARMETAQAKERLQRLRQDNQMPAERSNP